MPREIYNQLGQLLYGVCRDRYMDIDIWINDKERHYRGSHDLPVITDDLNKLLHEFDKLESYKLLKLLQANSLFSVAKAFTELEHKLESLTVNTVISNERSFPFRRFELIDGSAILQSWYGQFHIAAHISWFEGPKAIREYNKYDMLDTDRYGSFMPHALDRNLIEEYTDYEY